MLLREMLHYPIPCEAIAPKSDRNSGHYAPHIGMHN